MKNLIQSISLKSKENAARAQKVVKVLYAKTRDRNLFGWRYFMDDVLSEIVYTMIKEDFEKSDALYIYIGTQMTIDKARYCSAQKRRQNFESVPYEECFNVADNSHKHTMEKMILLEDIKKLLSPEQYELAEGVILYEQKLTKRQRQALNIPSLTKYLKER